MDISDMPNNTRYDSIELMTRIDVLLKNFIYFTDVIP